MVRKLSVLVVLAGLMVACGSGDGTPVIAKVQGKKITQGQFDAYAAFKRLRFRDASKKEAAVKSYLDREFLTAVIEEEGYLDRAMTDAELNEFRKEMVISRYFEKFLNDTVTDQTVKNYYNTHSSEYEHKKAHVAHILIRTNRKMSDIEKRAKLTTAQEAYSRLVAGEAFAETAKDYSEDGVSSKKGGELGWIREGSVSPEFSETLFGLEPGAVSEPFETPFGYHIVKLLESPKVMKQPFQTVAGDIRYQLRNKAKKAEMDRLLKKIKG